MTTTHGVETQKKWYMESAQSGVIQKYLLFRLPRFSPAAFRHHTVPDRADRADMETVMTHDASVRTNNDNTAPSIKMGINGTHTAACPAQITQCMVYNNHLFISH